jgi:hypothetical protein
MGTVELFLGTHVQWLATDNVMSVHLSQTGSAAHLVKDNNIHTCNITPDATLYCLELPINAIPESDEPDDCPALIECKRKYQSMVGFISWLAQSTCPDLTSTHLFLSSYCNKPSQGHWNTALYTLHYIHSTINYGFTFKLSQSYEPLHTFMSFPLATNTKAYTNAMPPQPHQHHCLTTYSNAYWGSQLGNAVCEGIQLPLFKLPSMSRAIVMHSRGPICWKADRQECTSLSSCKAEIQATNLGLCLTVNTWNMIEHLSSLGYPINNATHPRILYNANDA